MTTNYKGNRIGDRLTQIPRIDKPLDNRFRASRGAGRSGNPSRTTTELLPNGACVTVTEQPVSILEVHFKDANAVRHLNQVWKRVQAEAPPRKWRYRWARHE